MVTLMEPLLTFQAGGFAKGQQPTQVKTTFFETSTETRLRWRDRRILQQRPKQCRTRIKTYDLGTWNVRTLSRPGKMQGIGRKLDIYRMTVQPCKRSGGRVTEKQENAPILYTIVVVKGRGCTTPLVL